VNPSEGDDHLPISALQHLAFCEPQAALIHVLGRWAENAHTVVGRLVHERVDAGESTTRPGVVELRSVWLKSDRLRLRGIADVVEVRDGAAGRVVLPVEYKKAGRRGASADDVQLGAQAMALEEMMDVSITQGAIYSAKRKQRRLVPIDATLRRRVETLAARLHELVRERIVPEAHLDRRCDDCSLRAECGPELALRPGAMIAQLRKVLSEPA
jgi:CRISPR-associated exonuclease Cas4